MAILQLNSAHKCFGNTLVLSNVSFTLKTGQILGLFGRNGSGKSTLLKMLFGTQKGRINFEIDGARITPTSVITSQQIGYVPQHPFLPKSPRVRDIIMMYYQDEKTQDALFYHPTIAKMTASRIGDLSLGQRTFFEVLLIGNGPHPFLLLDEPFSMVDPLQKDSLKTFFSEISETKGIVLTDHYYDDVLQTTTHNMVLIDGVSHIITTATDLQKFEYLSQP